MTTACTTNIYAAPSCSSASFSVQSAISINKGRMKRLSSRSDSSCVTLMKAIKVAFLIFLFNPFVSGFPAHSCLMPAGSFYESCSKISVSPYITTDSKLADREYCTYSFLCRNIEGKGVVSDKTLSKVEALNMNLENCNGVLTPSIYGERSCSNEFSPPSRSHFENHKGLPFNLFY